MNAHHLFVKCAPVKWYCRRNDYNGYSRHNAPEKCLENLKQTYSVIKAPGNSAQGSILAEPQINQTMQCCRHELFRGSLKMMMENSVPVAGGWRHGHVSAYRARGVDRAVRNACVTSVPRLSSGV